MFGYTRASKSQRKHCHLHPAHHWFIQDLGVRCPTLLYLWVLKAADVRVQVEFDAFTSTRQGQSTDQQHQKHGKRESSSEVDNLLGEESGRLVRILAAVEGGQSSPLRGRRLPLGAARTLETHWSHLLCDLQCAARPLSLCYLT